MWERGFEQSVPTPIISSSAEQRSHNLKCPMIVFPSPFPNPQISNLQIFGTIIFPTFFLHILPPFLPWPCGWRRAAPTRWSSPSPPSSSSSASRGSSSVRAPLQAFLHKQGRWGCRQPPHTAKMFVIPAPCEFAAGSDPTLIALLSFTTPFRFQTVRYPHLIK